MTNYIKYIVGVVLFVLGVFLGTKCNPSQKGGIKSEPVLINVDTVFVPKIVLKDTIIYKPAPYAVYKDRIVKETQENGEPTLLVRNYKSKVNIEKDFDVTYDADVTGTLDKIGLSVVDTRPQKVVERTLQVTVEKEIKVPTTGLYVGGFSSPTLSAFGPSVELVTPKFSVGLDYNIKSTSLQPLAKTQIRLGYNLFPNKR